MTLPPVVIERDGKYLGTNGWVTLRGQALSFESERGAQEWLEDAPKALVSGARVMRSPHDETKERISAGLLPDAGVRIPMTSDYNPYDGR
jgi:hypothetical protein